MSSVIKAIVFDCFGVLTSDTWQTFLDNLPPTADADKAREVHRAYNSGQISKDECSKQIELATGRQFTEVEDQSSEIEKNQALLSYISELRQRHYKIGLLSNASSNWVREEFLTPDEQALFDDFVLSYELGLVKPEARLFAVTAERLGVKPAEAVLVDDKKSFCEEAQKSGMKAVLYHDFKQCQQELEELL